MELPSFFTQGATSISNGTHLDLDVVYQHALLLSAHFRYMKEDWHSGQNCLDGGRDSQAEAIGDDWAL